ncbi:hypothetical protein HaLaN_11159 [Haematococcus lacustris]|uniref:Uncharacterized protein n=1 Tax=Haematococcus lacustris TaxID=44745 RepID=A0A699YZL4_HAELA|nr:hypothetical protein HaLaN_11159 [Haematococcus lacustris]
MDPCIQAATQPAASEPGPSTPLPAKSSKRNEAEQAAEPTQPTKGKGKAQGKAAKAKPAPQPGSALGRAGGATGAVLLARAGEGASQGQGVPRLGVEGQGARSFSVGAWPAAMWAARGVLGLCCTRPASFGAIGRMRDCCLGLLHRPVCRCLSPHTLLPCTHIPTDTADDQPQPTLNAGMPCLWICPFLYQANHTLSDPFDGRQFGAHPQPYNTC